MKQLIIYICILIIASFELSNNVDSPKNRNLSSTDDTSSDRITVFLTGNILGSLKPCGCTSKQLGGLERRPEVFSTVPADKRLLIDSGSIVKNDKLQDFDLNLIKFDIITEAYDYLKYDIVNFTKQDLKIAQDNDLLDNHSFNIISPYGDENGIAPDHKNHFILDSEEVNVITVSFDPEQAPLEYIEKVFTQKPGRKNVNILILNTKGNTDFDKIIADISQSGVVDCIVCPANSNEPTMLSKPGEKPLVFTTGRYGRYIPSLVIENTHDNTLKLSFNYVPLAKEIKQDENLIKLYKDYQEKVKDAGLLGANPRLIHENGLKYIGSESCESSDCHSKQYKHQFDYVVWSESAHARAYQTLVDVGSQYDPECVACHVVGYDYESGFKTFEKTPHLINVGCEICHGPGSAHRENPYRNKNKTPYIEDLDEQCLRCHTPEHSADFAGHEKEKWRLIEHP